MEYSNQFDDILNLVNSNPKDRKLLTLIRKLKVALYNIDIDINKQSYISNQQKNLSYIKIMEYILFNSSNNLTSESTKQTLIDALNYLNLLEDDTIKDFLKGDDFYDRNKD